MDLSIAALSSRDPSMTTMTSTSSIGAFCANTLSRVCLSNSQRLKVGIIIDTFMRADAGLLLIALESHSSEQLRAAGRVR